MGSGEDGNLDAVEAAVSADDGRKRLEAVGVVAPQDHAVDVARRQVQAGGIGPVDVEGGVGPELFCDSLKVLEEDAPPLVLRSSGGDEIHKVQDFFVQARCAVFRFRNVLAPPSPRGSVVYIFQSQ